jgi:hypothetical protein
MKINNDTTSVVRQNVVRIHNSYVPYMNFDGTFER